MSETQPPPDRLNVRLTRLTCPGCKLDLSPEIHERTFIQNPHVLICQNNGCAQHGKRWSAPTVVLFPAP
jgi:hypothetical protein